jgi:hypothetical protein
MTSMQIPTQCYSYDLQATCYIDQIRCLHHTGKWFSIFSTYHSLTPALKFKKHTYIYLLYVLYDLHSKQKSLV